MSPFETLRGEANFMTTSMSHLEHLMWCAWSLSCSCLIKSPTPLVGILIKLKLLFTNIFHYNLPYIVWLKIKIYPMEGPKTVPIHQYLLWCNGVFQKGILLQNLFSTRNRWKQAMTHDCIDQYFNESGITLKLRKCTNKINVKLKIVSIIWKIPIFDMLHHIVYSTCKVKPFIILTIIFLPFVSIGSNVIASAAAKHMPPYKPIVPWGEYSSNTCKQNGRYQLNGQKEYSIIYWTNQRGLKTI